MATLPIEAQTIRLLYQEDIGGTSVPTAHTGTHLTWKSVPSHGSMPAEISDIQTELAARYIRELRDIDADDRVDYLLRANSALTEEHLKEIVKATDQWLDNEARDRLRNIASDFAKRQQGPSAGFLKWLTNQELARMENLLVGKECPDPILAMCYALFEARAVAHATYFIQQDRHYPQRDSNEIEQSHEEIKGDLEFVNAK